MGDLVPSSVADMKFVEISLTVHTMLAKRG